MPHDSRKRCPNSMQFSKSNLLNVFLHMKMLLMKDTFFLFNWNWSILYKTTYFPLHSSPLAQCPLQNSCSTYMTLIKWKKINRKKELLYNLQHALLTWTVASKINCFNHRIHNRILQVFPFQQVWRNLL